MKTTFDDYDEFYTGAEEEEASYCNDVEYDPAFSICCLGALHDRGELNLRTKRISKPVEPQSLNEISKYYELLWFE